MKKLNKVMEEIVEPTTDMVLYDPNYRPIYVNIPCNKYDTDDKPKYGIDLKWRPKGYGEEWGIVRRPTHDIGLVPIEHPTPSIMDFLEHGRKMEMHVTNDMGIPIRDPKCLLLINRFDQRLRRLAKRRIKQDLPFTTGKFKNFYKRYKLI